MSDETDLNAYERDQRDEAPMAPDLVALHEHLLAEGERWRRDDLSTARLEQHLQALARRDANQRSTGVVMLADRDTAVPAWRMPPVVPLWRPALPLWSGWLPVAAAVLLVGLAASIFTYIGTHRAEPGRLTHVATPGITRVRAIQPGDTHLPLPSNVAIFDISFSSAYDGWAVGTTVSIPHAEGHTVLIHYHDGVWTASSDTIPYAYLTGVAMVSEDDGWAVGSTDGSPVDGAGAVAILLHYTGGHWQRVDLPALADKAPVKIHMRSATFGYITGRQDTAHQGTSAWSLLLIYQNGAWTPFPNSFHTYDTGDGAVMVSPNEGWVISTAFGPDSLYHYDNSTWTRAASLPRLGDAVTAVAPNDIWAAGVTCTQAYLCQPSISHYDGVSWTPVSGPETPGFEEIDFPNVTLTADAGGTVWCAVNTFVWGSGIVNEHVAHDHTALYAYSHGIWTAQQLSVPGKVAAMTTDGNGGTWAVVEADAAPALPLGINILYTSGNGWSIYGHS